MLIDGVPHIATIVTALNADPNQKDYGEKFYDITSIEESTALSYALRDSLATRSASRAVPYSISRVGGTADMFTVAQKARLVKDQRGVYTATEGGRTKTAMELAYEEAERRKKEDQLQERDAAPTDRELLMEAAEAPRAFVSAYDWTPGKVKTRRSCSLTAKKENRQLAEVAQGTIPVTPANLRFHIKYNIWENFCQHQREQFRTWRTSEAKRVTNGAASSNLIVNIKE